MLFVCDFLKVKLFFKKSKKKVTFYLEEKFIFFNIGSILVTINVK